MSRTPEVIRQALLLVVNDLIHLHRQERHCIANEKRRRVDWRRRRRRQSGGGRGTPRDCEGRPGLSVGLQGKKGFDQREMLIGPAQDLLFKRVTNLLLVRKDPAAAAD